MNVKSGIIYNKTVLNAEQKNELELVIESLTYTCGSRMQEIEGSLTGLVEKVYVRANLTCVSCIEYPTTQPSIRIYAITVALLRN